MPRNKLIQIKVSQQEYKLIVANRNAKGFLNTSQFFRDLALNSGFSLSAEQKLNEIYKKIVGG